MTTDRELAQTLGEKKKKNSAFDAMGAFNDFHNQNKTDSVVMPLDFGKAIPTNARAGFIKAFNPTTRSFKNPTYYDPTDDVIKPTSDKAGFWHSVGSKMETAYNFTSRLVSFGLTYEQQDNPLWNLAKGNTEEIKKVWNASKDISPGQAAMGVVGELTSPLVGAATAIEDANARIMGGESGNRVQEFIDNHALTASHNFDILNEQDRKKAFEVQNFGKVGSWMGDFVSRFTIDPTIFAGKAVKVYKGLAFTVKGVKDFERILSKSAAGTEKLSFKENKIVASFDNFLNETDKFNSEADFFRVRSIRESSNPAVLSNLLNDANKIENQAARHAAKTDIIHMAMGNHDAYMRLAKSERLIAAKLGSLRTEVDGAQYLGQGVDDLGNPVFDSLSKGPVQEKANELIKGHEEKLASLYKQMSAESTLNANVVPHIDSLSGLRNTFSNSQRFVDLRTTGIGGAVVRFHSGFFYKRPKSWINFEDNQSVNTVDNLLSRVVGISDKRAADYKAKIANVDAQLQNPKLTVDELDLLKTKRRTLAADFEQAHFTVEKKNLLFSKYTMAANADERSLAYQAIEKEIFNTVAKQFGYNEKQILAAYGTYAGAKTKMHNLIKERSYSGGVDTTTGQKLGAKIISIPDTEGLTHVLPLPLNESQLVKEIATLNVDDMYKVLGRATRAEAGFKNSSITQNLYKSLTQGKLVTQSLVDDIDQMLKFQVLARIGYPIRNVGEGSLRIMASVGPLALAHAAGAGFKNLTMKGARKLNVIDTFKWAQNHELETERLILKSIRDTHENPLVIDAQIKEIDDILAGKIDPDAKFGFGTMELQGHTFQDALGSTPEQLKFIEDKFVKNASQIFETVMTNSKDRISNAMQTTGDFVDIIGSDPQWAEAYLRVVNRQIRGSKITSMILEGKSFDDVVTYLTKDPEGIRKARVIGAARGGETAKEIARLNFENISHIFPDWAGQGFRDIAAKRSITAKDIEKHLGTIAERYPTVNGAQVSAVNGTHPVSNMINGIYERFYNTFGQIPEDTLTKSPLYVTLYRNRMAASVANALETTVGDTLSPKYMKLMEERARQWARSELRRNLYDLSERTDSAHAVKYFFPFFGAFSDVMEKWGRIAIDDPSVLGKMNTIFNSPDRNGMTEVRNGVTYINIPSSWAKAMSLGRSDHMAIPKTSLNLIFQGGSWWNPGAGWFVQAAASKFVTNYPALETNKLVQEILPYGAQNTGVKDILIQSGALRKLNAVFDVNDPRRISLTTTVMAEEMTKWQNGERDTQPTKAEINDKTIRILSLDVASRLVLPFAATTLSPFQFYIDEYQRMRLENPDTASTEFYNTYGDAYYNMAVNNSRNNTGINATADAAERSNQLSDLIAKNPEYGWLVVGSANNGEFNSGVFKDQYNKSVAPGSTTKFREKLSPEEAFSKNQSDKGWIQFKNASAQIEAMRIRAGFNSINQKGAEFLAAKKREIVDAIGKSNPDWFKSYTNIDTGKIVSFLRYAKDISSDPRIANRPDIKSLNLYINARERIVNTLSTRESRSITSDTNTDLAVAWNQIVGVLLNNDVTFNDIYSRMLEKDDLSRGV